MPTHYTVYQPISCPKNSDGNGQRKQLIGSHKTYTHRQVATVNSLLPGDLNRAAYILKKNNDVVILWNGEVLYN